MNRDWRAEHDVLDNKLARIANLVSALDVIAWSFAQHRIAGELGQIRDAVIGIHSALERELEDSTPGG